MSEVRNDEKKFSTRDIAAAADQPARPPIEGRDWKRFAEIFADERRQLRCEHPWVAPAK
jgi:hypothetical protein